MPHATNYCVRKFSLDAHRAALRVAELRLTLLGGTLYLLLGACLGTTHAHPLTLFRKFVSASAEVVCARTPGRSLDSRCMHPQGSCRGPRSGTRGGPESRHAQLAGALDLVSNQALPTLLPQVTGSGSSAARRPGRVANARPEPQVGEGLSVRIGRCAKGWHTHVPRLSAATCVRESRPARRRTARGSVTPNKLAATLDKLGGILA